MLTTVEGVYRDGKIELIEQPPNVHNEARVIVTFLESGQVDLPSHGIDQAQAAELRARLGTFAEEWDSAEMDIYDNYDAHKSRV
jgi:hypothetical protein